MDLFFWGTLAGAPASVFLAGRWPNFGCQPLALEIRSKATAKLLGEQRQRHHEVDIVF